MEGKCTVIKLHVLTANEPAINLYSKHSFQIKQMEKDYYDLDGDRGKHYLTFVVFLNLYLFVQRCLSDGTRFADRGGETASVL